MLKLNFCVPIIILYTSGVQPAARGPHVARYEFSKMKKNFKLFIFIYYLNFNL